MTIATTPELDAPTTQLEPTAEPVVDSFPLLDHRARERAIPRRLAPAGQYLAFEDQLIRLDSRITHLGRRGASDIRFEDQRVSRDHAIIARHGRRARVLDNRSANGTFVNGRRIVAMEISDGDVIRLGPLAMQYVEVP
jgi:FHA domain